ncbi:uncharacterized protein SCHCODRAFT_02508216, partial [Schizophyllum commune H4-8]|uniref:uncharacterized protein n=1 Tax=Schizophyllum commune (strain H4-8 / FGSC 9210) TaxID=578458 RepID=UPI0021604D88
MLRAYATPNCAAWAEHLSELAHSYNSSVHSSTKQTPQFLLMGYNVTQFSALGALGPRPVARPELPSLQAEHFVMTLENYRAAARDAVVMAQERQARAYNKGRKPMEEYKPGD